MKLKIEGMTCDHCVLHVKQALTELSGVTSVEVNLQTGEAVVEGHAQSNALIAALETEGYKAQICN